jgi:hypothetical protein
MSQKEKEALRTRNTTDLLVGKFFHSFIEGKLSWQGEIKGVIHDKDSHVYLVQLYEWFHGIASEQKLVSISEMKGWLFYDSVEDLHDAYESLQAGI